MVHLGSVWYGAALCTLLLSLTHFKGEGCQDDQSESCAALKVPNKWTLLLDVLPELAAHESSHAATVQASMPSLKATFSGTRTQHQIWEQVGPLSSPCLALEVHLINDAC